MFSADVIRRSGSLLATHLNLTSTTASSSIALLTRGSNKRALNLQLMPSFATRTPNQSENTEEIMSSMNGTTGHDEGVTQFQKRSLAQWVEPSGSHKCDLYLQNSLTRQKERFVPRNGKQVNWYICGPTVYDSSHMGHARSYVSFDILRRVLNDYFGYDVNYIMNITDIDDKIIKKARHRYLLANYKQEDQSTKQLLDDMVSAMGLFQVKFDAETDAGKKDLYRRTIENANAAAERLERCITAKEPTALAAAKHNLVDTASDILCDWLDANLGSSVSDVSIFTTVSKQYENEFLEDMASLNVQAPDVLTRVSEYVPEVIEFIEKIVEKKLAYVTSDGSVYFDTMAFDKDPTHHYAKLVPEAFTDAEALRIAMREGEGELSISADAMKARRSHSDFALWKASKPGEPKWPSPWGAGRPGWHIECSVMASAVVDDQLDIHSGGFDLKFPHHDNEIAQSEAYFGCNQWSNYWLHAGTLRIQGLKMSKSLKNFTTIREALKTYTARQIRILFLMHNWSDALDFSNSTMERALQWEKMSNEFFLVVKHYMRLYYKPAQSEGYRKQTDADRELSQRLHEAKRAVHQALCDSIHTPQVMEAVRELVAAGNVYIKKCEDTGSQPNCVTLRQVALYMTRILDIFGANADSSTATIGFVQQTSGDDDAVDKESTLMPYLTVLAEFREGVRTIAREAKCNEVLKECDRLRDDMLPPLGVRFEDQQPGTLPRIKLVDPQTLIREVEQKRAIEAAKQAEKERKAAEKSAKEAEKRIPPGDYFRRESDKYSQFDDKGIPTHNAQGEELSKKLRKKLEKLYQDQEKKYEAAMAEQ